MSIFRTILDEDQKILQLKVPQSLHDPGLFNAMRWLGA